jgi:hypothetical protein
MFAKDADFGRRDEASPEPFLMEGQMMSRGDKNNPLYHQALAVEQDRELAAEMAEWEAATIGDGLGGGVQSPPSAVIRSARLGLVLPAHRAYGIEDRGHRDDDDEVEDQRGERGIAGDRQPADLRRVDRTEALRGRYRRAGDDAAELAEDECAIVEPSRVEAADDRRQCLDDPDHAQKLQLDSVLQRQASTASSSARSAGEQPAEE